MSSPRARGTGHSRPGGRAGTPNAHGGLEAADRQERELLRITNESRPIRDIESQVRRFRQRVTGDFGRAFVTRRSDIVFVGRRCRTGWAITSTYQTHDLVQVRRELRRRCICRTKQRCFVRKEAATRSAAFEVRVHCGSGLMGLTWWLLEALQDDDVGLMVTPAIPRRATLGGRAQRLVDSRPVRPVSRPSRGPFPERTERRLEWFRQRKEEE